MCGYDFDICCFKARLLQQRDTDASFVYIMTSKPRAIYCNSGCYNAYLLVCVFGRWPEVDGGTFLLV